LLDIANVGSINLDELVALSYYLGHFYAECVGKFCGGAGIPLTSIDLVGSHGQTVAHLSQPRLILGSRHRGTLQIGEAEVIAKRLGIFTVSDFRAADIALGGSGAPLVPIYHQCRFAEPGCLRVIVNIGGIANITLLDGTDRIAATDTGPGNCLIDGCMQALYGHPYDAGGKIALSGSVDPNCWGVYSDENRTCYCQPRSIAELFELAIAITCSRTWGRPPKKTLSPPSRTNGNHRRYHQQQGNGAPRPIARFSGGVLNDHISSRLNNAW
jgi:anhydro-N-acetylmuramic acid kinase